MKRVLLVLLLLFTPSVSFAQNQQPGEVVGCIYNSVTQTWSNLQTPALQCDQNGNLKVVLPNGISPQTTAKVSGTNSTTGTGSTSLISAVAANRIYVTGWACGNTGANTSLVSFQDGSGGTTIGTTIAPNGGGSNNDGTLPMFWTTAGNGLFFAFATGTTTGYCTAWGFSGP